MKVIQPTTVTDSNLTSSNVAENDYAQWNSATSYVTGNRVIVLSTHKIYEAAQNNTNVNPVTDDGTNWITLGATNRWKAFDQKIGDPVTNTTSIEYVFTPAQKTTAVALFGVGGATANVTVTDSIEGEVYNETVSLLDNTDVIDWYTYFFEDISYTTEALFLDIPPYAGAAVEVTVSGATGATVELGQLVIGSALDLGLTIYGTSIGIEDFSRKETDTFGNFIIVERAFANLVDFDVTFETQNANRLRRFLADYRAKPLVYIGNPDPVYGTIVYGFYRNFDITLSSPSLSYASIEVEGLT